MIRYWVCCVGAALLTACDGPRALSDLPRGIAYIPNAEHAECAITRVVDGDTIAVHCGTHAGNVRLVGFDTPETHRPGCPQERMLGERAKRTLENVLRTATNISVTSHGRDKYRRALAALRLDGRALAEIMISKHLAVAYDGGRRIDWCRKLIAA